MKLWPLILFRVTIWKLRVTGTAKSWWHGTNEKNIWMSQIRNSKWLSYWSMKVPTLTPLHFAASPKIFWDSDQLGKEGSSMSDQQTKSDGVLGGETGLKNVDFEASSLRCARIKLILTSKIFNFCLIVLKTASNIREGSQLN